MDAASPDAVGPAPVLAPGSTHEAPDASTSSSSLSSPSLPPPPSAQLSTLQTPHVTLPLVSVSPVLSPLPLTLGLGPTLTRGSSLTPLDTSGSRYVSRNGSCLQWLDYNKGTCTSLYSSHGGWSAHAVSPCGSLLVVGERGPRPRLLVFSASSCVLLHELSGGADTSYSCLSFIGSPPTRLASIADAPDHTLTIWDFTATHPKPILKTRGVPSETWLVSFSRLDPSYGHLASAGTGYIKFWEMAETFTGLKLQGTSGKFGWDPLESTCRHASLSIL